MSRLELDKIQGNIVPGFNKDHAAFVFVRFQGTEQARAWAAALAPELTPASAVHEFRQAFNELRGRAPHPNEPDGGALRHISATWTNFALSFAGLRLLMGQAGLGALPGVFRLNRVPGAAPGNGPEPHAVVILAADRAEDLDAELGRQRRRMAEGGVLEVRTLCCATLPGDLRGHEHFGFKDGISQPRIAGTDWGSGAEVAAGEFILGYTDQTQRTSGDGFPAWMRNGSFMAFVQMQQHVATFWSTMQQQARHLGLSPADLAAWVVGRTDAGEKLSDPPGRTTHIRRAYPRWIAPTESLRRRIIRRGMPYGPAWVPGEADGLHERGLAFVAYQADLERQFEHVWTRWLGDKNFPVPAAGTDALVGQTGALDAVAAASWTAAISRPVAVTRADKMGGFATLRFPSFVTPAYGGYFFSPAIGTTFWP